jgi:hypothetical protein
LRLTSRRRFGRNRHTLRIEYYYLPIPCVRASRWDDFKTCCLLLTIFFVYCLLLEGQEVQGVREAFADANCGRSLVLALGDRPRQEDLGGRSKCSSSRHRLRHLPLRKLFWNTSFTIFGLIDCFG